MKKLIITVAIACAAVVSHAAAVNWDGFDIKDINGADYSGDALLHVVGIGDLTASGSIDAGELLGTKMMSDLLVSGQTYEFFFTSEDSSGNIYTSETLSALMATVGTASVSFEGNGTWSGSPVPEPTSGLMLLLGVAGLALRRKQK